MEQNGVRWLSSVLHCHTSLCCSSRSCGMQACDAVRGIVKHIHTHPPTVCSGGCTEGACRPLRDLQTHYLQCKDAACPLCATVSQQLNFTRPQPVTHAATNSNFMLQPTALDCNDNGTPDNINNSNSRSTVLYNRQPPGATNPTKPRDPNTCGNVFTAVNNDSRSYDGCSVSSSSGWGEDEDETDLETADHMLETRDAHVDQMLETGFEQLEAEEVHGLSKHGADTGMSTLSGSLLAFVTSAAARQESEQLVGFGQFLLHSLHHWPGTTTFMMSRGSASPDLLDASEQDHLQEGRNLWVHLLQDCPRITDLCAHPGCMQARRVLMHMIDCQDTGCSLCGPAKAPFASGRLAPLHEATRTRATDMNSWMQDLEGSLTRLNV